MSIALHFSFHPFFATKLWLATKKSYSGAVVRSCVMFILAPRHSWTIIFLKSRTISFLHLIEIGDRKRIVVIVSTNSIKDNIII